MKNTKDKNHIVIFTGRLIGAGGAERLLWEEEKFLREKGIKVTVLTFHFDKNSIYDYQPKDLQVLKHKNSPLSRIFALRHKLQKIKPDLVIASSNSDAIYLYLATMFITIPYIVHVHGTPFWFIEDKIKYSLIHKKVFMEIRESVAGHKEFIPIYPRWNIIERMICELLAIVDYFAVRKAREIIVLTNQINWEVEKLYGKKSIIARGCLPVEALSYYPKKDIRKILELQNKKIILSVGRLDPRKRIDLLIKAFAKISTKYKDLYLLIGGTGEDDKKIKNLVDDFDVCIKKKIIFLGFIPDRELFDYYSACDVFAFPSWTTSGITPYEALAVGKKIVWTSEADEPVLGNNHVFVANPNVEEFAGALEKAINTNIEEKIDLSDYTWEKYFETVYKYLCPYIKK